MGKVVVKRDERGRILPGQPSINPKGRPKKDFTAEKRQKLQDADFNARVDYLLAEGGTLPVDEMPPKAPEPATPQRDEITGKFLKGNTEARNNAGTVDKVITANDVRRRIGRRIHKVVDVLFEQAESGDTTASKLLLDRFVPNLRMTEHVGLDVSTLPKMIIATHVEADKALDVVDAEVIDQDDKVSVDISDIPL